MTKALERRRHLCYAFDSLQGPAGDVLNRQVMRRIKKLIAGGGCLGICAAPPCGTYSIACRPAKRSRQYVFGLPVLTEANRRKTEHANKVTAALCEILETARRFDVPWIIENPQTSLIWRVPRLMRIAKQAKAEPVTLHQCAYGTPWRKATTLLTARMQHTSRLERLCKPAADKLCSHSGRPHITLQGSLTSRAAEFPRALCDRIALVMVDTAWSSGVATAANTFQLKC